MRTLPSDPEAELTPTDDIVIHGAREHNLKDVTVTPPAQQAGLHHRPVRARASRRWPSTPCTPRASAATSSRCRRTRGSSSGRWTSPTSTPSRGSRRPSPSTRRRPRATRARRWAPSPRSTTTCGCCTPASATRTARSAAGRSRRSRWSRSSTRCWRSRRGRAFTVDAPIVRGAQGRVPRRARRRCAARASPASASTARRDLIEDAPALDKKFKHDIAVVVDRLVMKADLRKRLADSVETALRAGRRAGRDRAVEGERDAALLRALRLSRARRVPGRARAARVLLQLAHGACPRCTGSGSQPEIDPELVVPDPRSRSPRARSRPGTLGDRVLRPAWSTAIAEHWEVDVDAPWGELPEEQQRPVPVRHRRREGLRHVPEPVRAASALHGGLRGHRPQPRAPLPRDRLARQPRADRELHDARPCPACNGARLQAASRWR